MASSSSSLQLLRYGTSSSSSRLGRLPALHRPSPPPSVRLRQPATRGRRLRSFTAASYHDDEAAAGHGGDFGITATSTLLLRQQVVDDAAVTTELRAAKAGRAPQPPKGRKEGDGGSGGKVHAAPTLAAKGVSRAPAPLAGLPKEGHGGQGGSHN